MNEHLKQLMINVSAKANNNGIDVLYLNNLVHFRPKGFNRSDNAILILGEPSFTLGKATFQIVQHRNIKLTEKYKGSLVHEEWVLGFLAANANEAIKETSDVMRTRVEDNTRIPSHFSNSSRYESYYEREESWWERKEREDAKERQALKDRIAKQEAIDKAYRLSPEGKKEAAIADEARIKLETARSEANARSLALRKKSDEIVKLKSYDSGLLLRCNSCDRPLHSCICGR